MSSLSKLELRIRDTEAPCQKDHNLGVSQKLELSFGDTEKVAPLSELSISGCNLFFLSQTQPTFGLWKWFVQLADLRIEYCNGLNYWPE